MTAYVFTAASYFLSNRRTLYVNFHRRSVDYLEFPLCCSLVLAADGILGSILTLCGHVKFDTQLLSDQGEILHRVLSQFHHSPRSERTMLNPSIVLKKSLFRLYYFTCQQLRFTDSATGSVSRSSHRHKFADQFSLCRFKQLLFGLFVFT